MHRANVALFLIMVGLLGVAPILLALVYVARRQADARRSLAETVGASRLTPIAVLATLLVVGAVVGAWTVAGRASTSDDMAGMAGMDGGSGSGATWAVAHGSAPGDIAGQALTSYVDGSDAVAQVKSLHLQGFDVVDAWIATYGDGRATVWRSEARDAPTAARQVTDMRAAIRVSGSAFEPPRLVPGERSVYTTFGMGQVHFFFARGRHVWWLATEPSLAPRALTRVLEVAR